MIYTNLSLTNHNTFHVPCTATYGSKVTSVQDVQEVVQTSERTKSKKKIILGGGSNVLFTDELFDGFVLKNEIMGKEVIEKDEHHITLKVGGGENRDEFVHRTIQQSLFGLENLVSIPGTVGAAPMQNIGAYGVEVETYISKVLTLDLKTGKEKTFTHDECDFSYRNSFFKTANQRYFISHVIFILPRFSSHNYTPNLSYRGVKEKVNELNKGVRLLTPSLIAQAITDIRASKLPDRHTLGTAGSFFKNPIIPQIQYKSLQKEFPDLVGRQVHNKRHVEGNETSRGKSGDSSLRSEGQETLSRTKLSAGQLIDKAGFKGHTEGNVGVYDKHALVLVNHGGGTGEDIVSLAKEIIEKVNQMFGVRLEPEVRWV